METVVVLCTCPDQGAAQLLANQMVAARLAACVTLIEGVQSVYLWEDKVEATQEVQLIIKTRRELFEALRGFIRDHHPYSVPEIVALPVVKGDSDYLDWVREVTR